MRRYKQDWAGGITRNFRMSWLRFVRRLIAHELFLGLTFDAPCSKFFTLTLFTVKSMDWFRCWPSLTIAASQVIGWLGFNNWLIDPTGAGHRQQFAVRAVIDRAYPPMSKGYPGESRRTRLISDGAVHFIR